MNKFGLLWSALLLGFCGVLCAEDVDKDLAINLKDFSMTAPEDWERREPKSRIVEHEFAALASEGDEIDGRVTMMFSGGSIEDNISRWQGQFTEIDREASPDVEERTIAGQTIHVVDITGTFVDKPAPFAPGVEREGFRMLGAIIETEEGNFFVKFYGPRRTVTDQEDNFRSLLESLQPK